VSRDRAVSDDGRHAVVIRAGAARDAEVWVRVHVEPDAWAARAWVERSFTAVRWTSEWQAWAYPPADGRAPSR
jgi:hypothetical protein